MDATDGTYYLPRPTPNLLLNVALPSLLSLLIISPLDRYRAHRAMRLRANRHSWLRRLPRTGREMHFAKRTERTNSSLPHLMMLCLEFSRCSGVLVRTKGWLRNVLIAVLAPWFTFSSSLVKATLRHLAASRKNCLELPNAQCLLRHALIESHCTLSMKSSS